MRITHESSSVRIRGIYRILNALTGDCYIGRSEHIYARWKQHRSGLRGGYHHAGPLHDAWHKFGEGAFRFEIIERLDVSDSILAAEQRAINAYKPVYNVSPSAGGGPRPGGWKHTDETKAKLRAAHLGRKGKPRSPESIERFRETHRRKMLEDPQYAAELRQRAKRVFTGHKKTDEQRAAISARFKGKKKSPEHIAKMRARRLSDEAKAKISAKAKGRKRPPCSEETRAKLSAKQQKYWAQWRAEGRKKTPEQRARMSAAIKASCARRRDAQRQLYLEIAA